MFAFGSKHRAANKYMRIGSYIYINMENTFMEHLELSAIYENSHHFSGFHHLHHHFLLHRTPHRDYTVELGQSSVRHMFFLYLGVLFRNRKCVL